MTWLLKHATIRKIRKQLPFSSQLFVKLFWTNCFSFENKKKSRLRWADTSITLEHFAPKQLNGEIVTTCAFRSYLIFYSLLRGIFWKTLIRLFNFLFQLLFLPLKFVQTITRNKKSWLQWRIWIWRWIWKRIWIWRWIRKLYEYGDEYGKGYEYGDEHEKNMNMESYSII